MWEHAPVNPVINQALEALAEAAYLKAQIGKDREIFYPVVHPPQNGHNWAWPGQRQEPRTP